MSHIWHFNPDNVGNMRRYANEIHWQEGTPGKGLIHDGIVETWSTLNDNPTHTEYCGTHGIDWDQVMVAFDISPDGGIWSFLKDQVGPEAREIIQEADPRLNVSQASADTWHLGSDGGDILNWDEGQYGKGIIDRDGHVYTWDAEEYEVHQMWLQEHPDVMPMRYLDIEPDGRVVDSGLGEPLTEMDEEVLREADPRLYVVIEEHPTWNLNQGLATV